MPLTVDDYVIRPQVPDETASVTLPAAFRAAVATAPNSIAVCDGERRLTWRDWQDQADALARGMQELGVEAGDVVAAQLPNSMDFLALHVAAAMIGAVFLPVHVDCGFRDLESVLRQARPALLVLPHASKHSDGRAVAGALEASIPDLGQVLIADGEPTAPDSLAHLAAKWAGNKPRPVDVRPDMPFVLMTSSGTTSSSPKICIHSHRGLLSNASSVIADGHGPTESDTILSASPYSFLFGMLSVHVAILTAARQVVLRRWDVSNFLSLLGTTVPTILYAVPTHLRDLLAELATQHELRPPRLREMRTGGAPVPGELVTSLRRALTDKVVVQWGMSEIGAGTYTRPADLMEETGRAIGRPSRGAEIRIVDDQGDPCAPGQTGELQFRSPFMFHGYLGEPELTRQAMTADGWLRTGDLASLEPDGSLTYRGRSAALINVGGRKVNAAEIEQLLEDFHGIREAVLVGCADERLGESPVLICRAENLQVSLHEVVTHLLGKGVAPYQLPTALHVVDQLPRTATGKIARRQAQDLGRQLMNGRHWWQQVKSSDSSSGEKHIAAVSMVCELAEQVVGSTIAPSDTFRDVGFDSLAGAKLRIALVLSTGLDLPPSLIFDHPTPNAIANLLVGQASDFKGATTVSPAQSSTDEEPTAIVGIGCRLPGDISSTQQFWDLLETGREAISELPQDRGWPLDVVYSPEPATPGSSSSRYGGFLSNIADFDADFFAIETRQAPSMDPQQRLLLETTWEALERAGIPAQTLRDSDTSVFVGMMPGDYAPRWFESPQSYDGTLGLGAASSVASGRVSYILGTHGTALTVDTACSSSLVATHLACEELRKGDTSLAIVGGVTVMSSPANMVEFSRQGLLAPDGRCRAFADDADGVGLAEGVGVLVLQRLSDAQRQGRKVLAVIRGSALTQDGASNGLTAPNIHAQELVIRRALRAAKLTTNDIDVVEAHGTGTRLGDTIELQALRNTYGSERCDDRPIWLGSVKSNLGHTQAAAGLISVIKMVLALQHNAIPPTLHADKPRQDGGWSSGPIRLVTETVPWPRNGRPRGAAVSSFGISGTNAHLILQEAPDVSQPEDSASPAAGMPWLLSAPVAEALPDMAGRLAATLATPGTRTAAEVGHALALGRTLFTHRAALFPDDEGDYTSALQALGHGTSSPHVLTGDAQAGPTVFVFPGHGTHWAGMAAALMTESVPFAAAVAECDDAFKAYLPWSVASVLRAAPGAPVMERPQVIQPATFTVMVALASLWRECGVEPDVVVGHSQGEIAAAYVAGGLTLSDAARIVAARGEVMDRIAGRGAMAALRLERPAAERWIMPWGDDLCVAVANGPRTVVISGSTAAVAEAVTRANEEGIWVRPVIGDVAFHSPQTDSLLDDLEKLLQDLRPTASTIPFISATTASRVPTEQMDSAYWRRNMRDPVDFHSTVKALVARGHRSFIEVSPHPVLGAAVQETAAETGTRVASIGSLRRDNGSLRAFLHSLAEAHVQGTAVDWASVFTGASLDPGLLPTYPFRRKTFWLTRPIESAVARPVALPDLATPSTPATPETLVARILSLPDERSRAELADLVCTSLATVLDEKHAHLITPEVEFEQLGLSSLAAVEVRNILAQALRASLPATIVFDHKTPRSLADHILDHIRSNDPSGGASEPAPQQGEGTSAPPGRELPDGFEAMYRRLSARGESEAAWNMVVSAARLRATFAATDSLDQENLPGFRHVVGRQSPTIVCVPSVVSLAGRAEYKKFAAPFSGMRDVIQLGEPGFRDGEKLPADLDALAAAHIAAIHRLAGDEPILLCGRSFGGWIAHVIGCRLAEMGSPPVGVVLIDTFWPGEEFVTKFIPRTLRRLGDRQEELGTELGMSRLTAIGWYLNLLREWQPAPSGLPTLYLLPEDETSIEQHLRSGGWKLPHVEVRVPADHFSIMDADATEPAAAVEEWLSRIPTQADQS
jgi:pimaricinolide synthase loading module/candicidin polyketide synthase FscA